MKHIGTWVGFLYGQRFVSAVLFLCLFASTFVAAEPDPILQEFTAIADALDASGHHFFYGTAAAKIADFEAQIAAINVSLEEPLLKKEVNVGDDFSISTSELGFTRSGQTYEKVNLLIALAMNCVITNELEKATDAIEEAFEIVNIFPELFIESVLKELDVVRSTVFLRRAELDNCIGLHNNECCVFPLSGGGVHSSKGWAEKAKESLLRLVAADSEDYRSRWLLNVVEMALGNFPDGVDPSYRLPASALQSDYDIKHFPNVAKAAGVDTFALSGGVLALDYDQDGLLDIAASSIGPRDPLKLYKNLGNGSFEDTSDVAGVSNQLGGLQIVLTDYNNDGYPDIHVLRGAWLLNFGKIRNSLLRNNGDGTFTDVTESSGLAYPAYPTQAAVWGDFDNDGDLDLAMGNEGFGALHDYPSQLFRNNGDGTFSDVSVQAGISFTGFVKGVAAGDYNNDGHLDVLFVVSFGETRLYRNNGDFTFTEVGAVAGVNGSERYGTGSTQDFPAWFYDYNNDGWLDIFICAYSTAVEELYKHEMGITQSYRQSVLYRNNGDGTFTNVTNAMNLGAPYSVMGAGFGDLDTDGWLDVYLTTGDTAFTSLLPNVMLRNNAGTGYQDVTFSGGFGNLQKGHGVLFADFNNDGFQDVYHVQGGAFDSDRYFNALYANPGHGNHFLHVSLVGTTSNRAAMGARLSVTVTTPTGQRTIHRSVGSVSSFGSLPFRQEVGLGNASGITEVKVYWPKTGATQIVTGAQLDKWIKVVEAQSGFETLPLNTFTYPTSNGTENKSILQVKSP